MNSLQHFNFVSGAPIPINTKMYSSPRLLRHNLTPTTKPLLAGAPHCCASPPNPNPIFRRDFTSSSFLLLLVTPQPQTSSNNVPSVTCADPFLVPTKQAYLDISIDGEPIGRIIIGLYGDTVPAGAARFSELVTGTAGLSYRRKEFVKIMPNYVQHGGLRSYGADSIDTLVNEWEKQNENCQTTRNVGNSVSIIVRDPSKPPPKMKLVARKGKLEIDEEQVGTAPNGTEFVIATRDSPELDGSALVVGTVLQGMDVVHRVKQVKTVQENSTSPYFRVAKLIGDKRAVVAERGFNRPYSKVVVTNCGLLR